MAAKIPCHLRSLNPCVGLLRILPRPASFGIHVAELDASTGVSLLRGFVKPEDRDAEVELLMQQYCQNKPDVAVN